MEPGLGMSNRAISDSKRTGDVTADFRYCEIMQTCMGVRTRDVESSHSGSIRTGAGTEVLTYCVIICKPVWYRDLEMSNRAISGSIRTRNGTENVRYCANVCEYV